MHKLYELKEKLMSELEGYAENGKFSKDDAEAIKALSASVEHIDNICENEDEYSGRMYPDMSYRGSYRDGGNGSSFARGRGRNARRDSMGRYSGDDGMEDKESMRREIRALEDRLNKM